MHRVSIIFGTRPEAIKLAPVIRAFRGHPLFSCDVCVTAQHRQMLDQVLGVFGIVPDTDLDLMQANQTLGEFTSRAILTLDHYMAKQSPELVLVQGDTTTVLCAALVAFYHRIPVGHVEAGLRTGSLRSPWPEELNRVLASRLTTLHFAPTELNKHALLMEGVSPEDVVVTGNTVVDALQFAVRKLGGDIPSIPDLPHAAVFADPGRPMVLITGHRRENFGEGLRAICRAIRSLADAFPKVAFVYPVHLNPNVQRAVFRLLAGRNNVHLIAPVDYLSFVALMARATLILTDSGGVQEEAPSLGKPVLIMRDTTERMEAVSAGTAKLVGTNSDAIFSETSRLLTDDDAYRAMVRTRNPFGDGAAAERILNACARLLSIAAT